jgi:CBS domain-containing protein
MTVVSVEEPISLIMTQNVVTVSGWALVADAAAMMVEKKISCLPVSLGRGPVGIITEKDIVKKVVAGGLDSTKIRVKEIMSVPLITISPTASVREAAEKMLKNEIRRLVIADEEEKLVGLVTMTDILKSVAKAEGNQSVFIRYFAEAARQR